MKEYYPVIHLITGPPPLDRNGGIWKIVKKELKNTIKSPKIMVQAFHFTTYNLSKSSWELWNKEDTITNQIKSFFPEGSIFVDSGGFQFLSLDKIDLSKWNIKLNQEDIYNLQMKYNPQKISNLDYPINPFLNEKNFKNLVDLNLNNIKILIDILKEDHKEIFFVVHGRNNKEIEYFYRKLISIVDFSNDNFNFALGSQVPLLKFKKDLVKNNIDFFVKLIKKDHGNSKKIHFFGLGGNLISNIDNNLYISYDNSTPIRNAMFFKWYNPKSHIYEDFTLNSLNLCECPACESLKKLDKKDIISLLSNTKLDNGLRKSDILGYIALHNIFYENDRINIINNYLQYSNFKVNNYNIEFKPTNNKFLYKFPIKKFKPIAPNLLLLECSYKKPYSKSISHIKIKNYLKNKINFIEGKDYEVIVLSGLYGPVYWKDENNPEIISYDFRLNNMTSQEHIENLKIKTATILNFISKKYDKKYAILRGIYLKNFREILTTLNFKIYKKVEDFHK